MLALPTLTPHNAILTFLLLTSIKWLLVPTYHSTDFDVHRLWLAITRHLPVSEWYFYDAQGTTKHTLDYPPLFAFFEYALSNNYITSLLLKKNGDQGSSSSAWLDEECLALLPVPSASAPTTTSPSPIMEVSDNCIRFHRGTVIISDVILFVGAYMAATAVASSTTTKTTTKSSLSPSSSSSSSAAASCKSFSWVSFILIVTNPGLLMLDHVHFQYNGMLLGVLLISIACMVHGAAGTSSSTTTTTSSSSLTLSLQQQKIKETQLSQQQRMEDVSVPNKNINPNTYGSQQIWELLAAATFAALLALKHLYLTLAPLFFFYLLRRHCFITIDSDDGGKDKFNDTANKTTTKNENSSCSNSNETGSVLRFSWERLLVLGFVTLLCFLGPFVPFLIQSDNPTGQMQQIFKRLFPFGRGLVHDYWAANVWALYLFGSRLVSFIFHRSPINQIVPMSIRYILDSIIPFPEPKPSFVALLLLIGLWPGGIRMAWKIGCQSFVDPHSNSGKLFIQALVFCSLSSFMLSYHVHEKSIMTAIIPMTLLAPHSRRAARLYIRMCTFGLFGLIPLLYRPEELLLKVVLYIAWVCGTIFILDTEDNKEIHYFENDDKNHCDCSLVGQGQQARKTTKKSAAVTKTDLISFVILGSVLLFMEVIHPIVLMPNGRMEFLPLMATSVVCAMGLAWCWLESYRQMRLPSHISPVKS